MCSIIIGQIAVVILIIVLVVKLKRKNAPNRWKWIAGCVICLIILFFLPCSPPEPSSDWFPSAEAVAQYACDGEIVMIVDGNESSLIVYLKNPGSYGYMISPKAESGYQIGRMSAHKSTSQTASMQHNISTVMIISSEETADIYVLVNGFVKEHCDAIQDSLNSTFILDKTPVSSTQWPDLVGILACAYLGNNFDVPYKVSITDAECTATAEFP